MEILTDRRYALAVNRESERVENSFAGVTACNATNGFAQHRPVLLLSHSEITSIECHCSRMIDFPFLFRAIWYPLNCSFRIIQRREEARTIDVYVSSVYFFSSVSICDIRKRYAIYFFATKDILQDRFDYFSLFIVKRLLIKMCFLRNSLTD